MQFCAWAETETSRVQPLLQRIHFLPSYSTSKSTLLVVYRTIRNEGTLTVYGDGPSVTK